jgi:hypothetical protein
MGAVMESKFKCSMEKYSDLQRLRDNPIKLKVEHKSAEERLQYFLGAGNMEMAKTTVNTVESLFKEIRLIEREIAKLESTCFAE